MDTTAITNSLLEANDRPDDVLTSRDSSRASTPRPGQVVTANLECQQELERAAACVKRVTKSVGPNAANRACARLNQLAALCILKQPCGEEIERVRDFCGPVSGSRQMTTESNPLTCQDSRSDKCRSARDGLMFCLARLQAEADEGYQTQATSKP